MSPSLQSAATVQISKPVLPPVTTSLPQARRKLPCVSNFWTRFRPDARAAERELALSAENAYRRTIADWQATRPTKEGASVTPGRASQRPSKGKAARQATSP